MHAHHPFPSHLPPHKTNGKKEVEMVNQTPRNKFIILSNILRGVIPLTYLFLLIECFDELNYGIGNATLPAIRVDLGLPYIQIALLLGLPAILNNLIEQRLLL